MRIPFVVFLLLAATTPFLQSEYIQLNDGKVINGVILEDTPDGILMEYYVTPTIRDQKVFPRDHVVRIVKAPADEKAFKALGTLVSPKTLLDTSFHDELILKKIPKFVSNYPYSSHLAELRAILVTLEGERERLRIGDRKINGDWITATAINADPYEMGAKIKYAEITELAAENNALGALQSCELLEKTYPGSASLPDTIDLGLTQIIPLQAALDKAKSDFDVLNKRRENALALAPGDQAIEIKKAIETEDQNTKTAIKNALSDGSKFFPVFPNNQEALDALQALIISETARWKLLSKTPMRDGITASKNCASAVNQGDLKTAQEQLALSEKLWPANAENARLKPLVEGLTKSQATAEAAKIKAAADVKK